MNEGSPSGFWRFSLGFYRRAGVAEACIRLQDENKVDVNLLLFLLWRAGMGRVLSVSDVEQLERRVAPWRESTVIPLRTVRRALKSESGLVPRPAAELFRTRIKAVELEAERLQQEAMEVIAQSSPCGDPRPAPARVPGSATEAASFMDAAHANLRAYAAVCRTPFPEREIATLLAALGDREPQPEE